MKSTLSLSLLFSGSLLLAVSPTALSQSQTKKNVLILNVDDLKQSLGCYGDSFAISPNIDRLAQQGTLMKYSYCQQAVCAASRVSVFTGMRPDSTGILDLHTHMRDINPTVLTMPEHFKNNGYASIGYGKILHGAKNDDPQSWTLRVKDEDLPYASKHPKPAIFKYQAPEIHAFIKKKGLEGAKTRKLRTLLKNNKLNTATECFALPDEAYPDGAIAKAGAAKLEELSKSKKPFYMVLGFRKPHLPFNAPKKYWDLYKANEVPLAEHQKRQTDRPQYAYHSYGELGNYANFTAGGKFNTSQQRQLVHGYYACVSYIDTQIGKIMQTLKQTGLDKNTIVVLWGDHGWHLGDHGIWCKHSNMEQATAAPLIILHPDGRKKQIYQYSTEFIDIFPTVCAFAGIEKPTQLEGTDLIPALLDASKKLKDFSVSQFPRNNANGYTIRSGNYRITYWMRKGYLAFEPFDKSKLKAVELYDYSTDPLEKKNLAKSPAHKEVLEQMSKKIEEFFASRKDLKRAAEMAALIKKHSRKGQK